jgi:hypothetical protein
MRYDIWLCVESVLKKRFGNFSMKNWKWFSGFTTVLIAAGIFLLFGAGAVPPETVDVPFNAYAPKQPIPYSHKVHAGDLAMDCSFCHTYARRSKNAGIPAMEQCMMCHKIINADKPDVQTMASHYADKKPIEWVKVHNLPTFVNFNHQRHVKAGFACQECHGPVETMEVVYRHAPLTMGWCVECHKDNLDKGASLDCWTCHK